MLASRSRKVEGVQRRERIAQAKPGQRRRPQAHGSVFFQIGLEMNRQAVEIAPDIEMPPHMARHGLLLGLQPQPDGLINGLCGGEILHKGCDQRLIGHPVFGQHPQIADGFHRALAGLTVGQKTIGHLAPDMAEKVDVEMTLQPAGKGLIHPDPGTGAGQIGGGALQQDFARPGRQIGAEFAGGAVFLGGKAQFTGRHRVDAAGQMQPHHLTAGDRRPARTIRRFGQHRVQHLILAPGHHPVKIAGGDPPGCGMAAVIGVGQIALPADEFLGAGDRRFEMQLLPAQQSVVVHEGHAYRALFGQHVAQVIDLVAQMFAAVLGDHPPACAGVSVSGNKLI